MSVALIMQTEPPKNQQRRTHLSAVVIGWFHPPPPHPPAKTSIVYRPPFLYLCLLISVWQVKVLPILAADLFLA